MGVYLLTETSIKEKLIQSQRDQLTKAKTTAEGDCFFQWNSKAEEEANLRGATKHKEIKAIKMSQKREKEKR